MTSPKASGPLWAWFNPTDEILPSSLRDTREEVKRIGIYDEAVAEGWTIQKVNVIPGHGRVVPVHLVEAIDLAFDGSNAHSDEWITNVRAAIRAAKEGAI